MDTYCVYDAVIPMMRNDPRVEELLDCWQKELNNIGAVYHMDVGHISPPFGGFTVHLEGRFDRPAYLRARAGFNVFAKISGKVFNVAHSMTYDGLFGQFTDKTELFCRP